jgi:hypothetical protein
MTATKISPEQLRHELDTQFYGTEQWHLCTLNRKVTCTDGVLFFLQNAGNGAFWFADIVASELYRLSEKYPFQSIHLIASDGKAKIFADDGDDNVFWIRGIEYTDCPDGDWHFYFTDNVILLPSEY